MSRLWQWRLVQIGKILSKSLEELRIWWWLRQSWSLNVICLFGDLHAWWCCRVRDGASDAVPSHSVMPPKHPAHIPQSQNYPSHALLLLLSLLWMYNNGQMRWLLPVCRFPNLWISRIVGIFLSTLVAHQYYSIIFQMIGEVYYDIKHIYCTFKWDNCRNINL